MRILSALIFIPLAFAQTSPVNFSSAGYVLDVNYPALQAACAAAGSSKPLLLSKTWASLGTQTLACNINALAGGILQPAAGATVAISGSFEGDMARHFDTSLGGKIDLSHAMTPALYPQWFGAQCGGADDTASVQAALNTISANRTIVFPCQSTISGTVYIPSDAIGTVLQGRTHPTFDPDTVGDSLVAKAGSPSFEMLRILAGSVRLQTFGVDCNHLATTGIVWSGALFGMADVSQTDNCVGDGMTVTPVGGPATRTTSQINAGAAASSTVTVAQATLSGVTLGDAHCEWLMVEYGTPRQETLFYRGSGNTLTMALSGKAAYTHPSGASIQCNGNNNSLTLNNPQWFGNGGWGLNIYPGSDQNNIKVLNPVSFGNAKGGELWSGFVGLHIGGHSEGNKGPAMQLGDANGGGPNGSNGRETGYITIEPFQDLENSDPSFNVVRDVCSFGGMIRFRQPSEFVPMTKGCPAIGHVTDVALGSGIDSTTDGLLEIKTALGNMTIQPGGNITDGLYFYGQDGKLIDFLNTLDQHSGGMAAGSDSTSYIASQFAVHGISPVDPNVLLLGYRTDSHRGFLQSKSGAGQTPIDLNPMGGVVTLGHSVGGITKTFANNAAAVAGGLAPGDIYAVSGTDPRQLAIVY